MSNKIELCKDAEALANIAFIGQTLGPFYLNDPVQDDIDDLFGAIAALDIKEAAVAWPFVAEALVEPSLALMQQGLEKGHTDDGLLWEYRRLFVGPLAKPAPPWGSVYTDHEGVIFGETAMALRRWMIEQAIERPDDVDMPDDHIGLMLLLMAWLAENNPEVLEEFLKGHFLTWSTHFLKQLIDATEQPFYRGLASLTRFSLEGIQAYAGIDVVYPRFYR